MEASSSDSTVPDNVSNHKDSLQKKNQWRKPTRSLQGSGIEYLKFIDNKISQRKSMRAENPIHLNLAKLPVKRTVTLEKGEMMRETRDLER